MDLQAGLAASSAEQIAHLNVVLLAIRNVNKLIAREKSRTSLLQKTCECLVETCGFRNAWIVLFNRNGQVKSLHGVGLDDSLDALRSRLEAGDMPLCIRTLLAPGNRQPCIVNDPKTECPDCHLAAGYEGYAGIAVRMEHDGKRAGILVVSLPREMAVDAIESDLLKEVAGDVAFALHGLQEEKKRRQAEKELKSREHLLSKIFETLPIGLWIADKHGKLLSGNPAGVQIWGGEPHVEQEGYGVFKAWRLPSHELVAPGDWALNHTVARGVTIADELLEIETFDGRKRIILNHTAPVQGDDGGIEGAIIVNEDITEQYHADQALRTSEERLALATCGTGIGIWDYWIAEDRLEWDERMFALFDMSPASFTHRFEDWSRCVLPAALPQATADFQAALNGEKDFSTEFPIVWPNGEIRYIKGAATVSRDDDGNPVRVVGVNYDITERKRAESSLHNNQEELLAIYENSPVIMVLLDKQWSIRKSNLLAERHADRFAAEMQGMSFGTAFCCLYAPEHPDGCGHGPHCAACVLRNTAMDTLSTGHVHTQVEVKWMFQPSVGRRTQATMLLSTARVQLHEETLVLVNLLDISDSKQAEEERTILEDQLRQAQKMEAVGRLAGGIAHDFNNLLSVILGYAEMTLMNMDSKAPHHNAIRQIAEAGRRAVELTRQLLTFSRKQAVAPRVLKLNTVVTDQKKLLGRLIGEDIRIEFIPAANLWDVRIDPGQIHQVLANLAVNARDAIPEGGVITISTENVTLPGYVSLQCGKIPPGDYVKLTFRDTGVGMDTVTRERIFEPFFSTKEEGKGTGLGLAIVYGVVKQYGGDIQVFSQPNAGTTFTLLFPRHVPVKEDKVESEAATIPRGTETVLIVEDDELVLRLAEDILGDCGYRVLIASNIDAACDLIRKHDQPLHLLLADVIMPGGNGRELQTKLEQIKPGFATLFMSGYTPDVLAGRGGIVDEGFTFIQKPFSMDSLSQKVREVLDRPKG
jgi:PAS domain S-box-containing protein